MTDKKNWDGSLELDCIKYAQSEKGQKKLNELEKKMTDKTMPDEMYVFELGKNPDFEKVSCGDDIDWAYKKKPSKDSTKYHHDDKYKALEEENEHMYAELKRVRKDCYVAERLLSIISFALDYGDIIADVEDTKLLRKQIKQHLNKDGE